MSRSLRRREQRWLISQVREVVGDNTELYLDHKAGVLTVRTDRETARTLRNRTFHYDYNEAYFQLEPLEEWNPSEREYAFRVSV